MSEIACVNCLYWQPLPQIQSAGRCRVCPPAIGSAINNLHGAIWPVSMHDDWCGSFRFSDILPALKDGDARGVQKEDAA